MINRRKLLATTLAAAAIVPRASLGQTMRKVKIGIGFHHHHQCGLPDAEVSYAGRY